MALSSLTYLGNQAPSSSTYTAFSPPIPGRLTQGDLENQVSFSLSGYSTQNQNVVLFGVAITTNTTASLSLSTDGLVVNVVDQAGSNSVGYTDYYSVNIGLNSVTGGGWQLQLNATMKDKTTGTWVFVKGTTEPPPHR